MTAPGLPIESVPTGDAGRHLRGRQERVEALQGRALHRNAEDGQERVRRGDPRQMGGAAGRGDDDLDAPAGCRGDVVGGLAGRAVSGENAALVGDLEMVEHLGRVPHGVPVGLRPHQDGHEGVRGAAHRRRKLSPNGPFGVNLWRVKRAFWVAVAFGIAAAGAWVYAALARQENDDGRQVRLLAIAEEQRLDLSLTRSGRLVTRVPEEGELVKAGDAVARIEEPGLAEDASDFERQRELVRARDRSRLEEILRLQADMAQIAGDEKRIGRLVAEGVAPSADLETLQHRRDAAAAGIRAREAEKGQLEAEDDSLRSRLEKVRRFEREGTLTAAAGGTVLTRYHREGEIVAAGSPVVTLQVDAPYLRVEVPEERLSSFSVGSSVTAWPQARPDARFSAKVVSVRPRSEFATRRNWGLQSRDLRTFSVRLQPADVKVVSGQTFVVEAGKS